MSFVQGEYLQWLFVLPFLILIYTLQVYFRKKAFQKYLGSQSNFLRSKISDVKRNVKIILSICVLILLIIALARPQSSGEKIEVQNRGLYVFLLIDVSKSMLAEDIKPNRLSFMKKEMSRFLDMSSGDHVALGVFAHSAFLLSPFTNDLSAVKSYLNDLSPDYLTSQGTNFERVFHLSSQVFKKIKENKQERSARAIVIASDGEDHSKESEKAIKKLLLQKDIRVFTVSFGTQEGGVIPVKDYKDQITGYKKDIEGNLVITKLKSESLKNFAKWGKGSYHHAVYGGSAIEQLRQNLDRLEKDLFEKTIHTKKKEEYQWFLILAFFIALIEWVLSDRAYFKKSHWFFK